ncbi:MAG: hypothetical protein HRF48_14370 [Chloroflexota bacterium]|jgi:hypothetical protein
MFDINQFLRGLEGPARKRAINAGVQAVNKFAHDLIRRAKELTPIKTGTR